MQSVTRDGDTVDRDADRRPHRRGLALPAGARLGARTPPDMGLEEAGVDARRRRLRRASTGSRAPRPAGVYAAGDCTGVLMLASVAAMQGRIAMWHFLGDAVAPLDLKTVSSNVFTAPEIATVGWSQQAGRRRRDRRRVRHAAAARATRAPRCRASATAS